MRSRTAPLLLSSSENPCDHLTSSHENDEGTIKLQKITRVLFHQVLEVNMKGEETLIPDVTRNIMDGFEHNEKEKCTQLLYF